MGRSYGIEVLFYQFDVESMEKGQTGSSKAEVVTSLVKLGAYWKTWK